MNFQDHLNGFSKMRDETRSSSSGNRSHSSRSCGNRPISHAATNKPRADHNIDQKYHDFLNGVKETNKQPTQQRRRARHASGGHVALTRNNAERLAKQGRFGDTKLAKVGTLTAKLMDGLVHGGHKQINPKTGLREYAFCPNCGGDIAKCLCKDPNFYNLQKIKKNPDYNPINYDDKSSYDGDVTKLKTQFLAALNKTKARKDCQEAGNCVQRATQANRAYQRSVNSEPDSDNSLSPSSSFLDKFGKMDQEFIKENGGVDKLQNSSLNYLKRTNDENKNFNDFKTGERFLNRKRDGKKLFKQNSITDVSNYSPIKKSIEEKVPPLVNIRNYIGNSEHTGHFANIIESKKYNSPNTKKKEYENFLNSIKDKEKNADEETQHKLRVAKQKMKLTKDATHSFKIADTNYSINPINYKKVYVYGNTPLKNQKQDRLFNSRNKSEDLKNIFNDEMYEFNENDMNLTPYGNSKKVHYFNPEKQKIKNYKKLPNLPRGMYPYLNKPNKTDIIPPKKDVP